MPHQLLIFSQSDWLIQTDAINSHTSWQTVQIQISWLFQKPTDLDLHCLQRQGISGFKRTKAKKFISYTEKNMGILLSFLYGHIQPKMCFFWWYESQGDPRTKNPGMKRVFVAEWVLIFGSTFWWFLSLVIWNLLLMQYTNHAYVRKVASYLAIVSASLWALQNVA